jgi:Leucine-rich repeat (LRR) protein
MHLSLSSNKLHGSIPGVIGDLWGLQSLDLSNNELTGHIPQEIGLCAALRILNLQGNSLTGAIPTGALAHLNQLAEVDLTGNMFSLGNEKHAAVHALQQGLGSAVKIHL